MQECVSTEDSRKGARLPEGLILKQRSLKLPNVTHISRLRKGKEGENLTQLNTHLPPVWCTRHKPQGQHCCFLSVQMRKVNPKEVMCCQGHHGHRTPG